MYLNLYLKYILLFKLIKPWGDWYQLKYPIPV